VGIEFGKFLRDSFERLFEKTKRSFKSCGNPSSNGIPALVKKKERAGMVKYLLYM